jgi:hypothetical protein
MHVQPDLAHNWLIFAIIRLATVSTVRRESRAVIQGDTATLREIERNFHV